LKKNKNTHCWSKHLIISSVKRTNSW